MVQAGAAADGCDLPNRHYSHAVRMRDRRKRIEQPVIRCVQGLMAGPSLRSGFGPAPRRGCSAMRPACRTEPGAQRRAGTLEAVASSALFGFDDDIVIQINAHRIVTFLAALGRD
jgi:hypothetical protein